MRKTLYTILVLFIVLCVAGCNQKKEAKSGAMSDEVEDVAVYTTTVTTSSFTRVRAYVGNVSASKSVKVIPLASERILKYPWENGDFVNEGDVIAEIRNEVSKKGVEALNAQLRSVDAQLKAAERESARVKSMYESNIVSRQNYDQALDGVTTLKASREQIQASIQQSKLGLDYAKVVAPISGVISQKNSEVGDIASSAMPLCVLLDLTTLKVTINVNEEDTSNLSLGQEIDLRFDAFPGEVTKAKITRILPYVNTTSRTNTIEAEFPNIRNEVTGQYKYKPGMYTRVEIGLKTTNDAIVVPPVALILEPELLMQQVAGLTLRRVYVLKPDSTVESRIVKVGEQNGNLVQIYEGLNPGDKLIIRGHHSLRDGDKVRDMTNSGNDVAAAKPAEPAVAKAPAVAEPSAPVAAVADNAIPAADAAPAPTEDTASPESAKAADTAAQKSAKAAKTAAPKSAKAAGPKDKAK